MSLVLDICQGVGLACAVGIRPFAPGLLAGALAAANAGVDFGHTDYSFLESPVFLAVLGIGLALFTFAERRFGPGRLDTGAAGSVSGAIGPALGGLLFAGTLADHGHASWPGLIGGVLCALVAYAAIRALLVRVRGRLDDDAGAALPVYAEMAGIVCAGLSVLLPPFGIVALIFLAALLVTGRRRAGEKYAGLRILR